MQCKASKLRVAKRYERNHSELLAAAYGYVFIQRGQTTLNKTRCPFRSPLKSIDAISCHLKNSVVTRREKLNHYLELRGLDQLAILSHMGLMCLEKQGTKTDLFEDFFV